MGPLCTKRTWMREVGGLVGPGHLCRWVARTLLQAQTDYSAVVAVVSCLCCSLWALCIHSFTAALCVCQCVRADEFS